MSRATRFVVCSSVGCVLAAAAALAPSFAQDAKEQPAPTTPPPAAAAPATPAPAATPAAPMVESIKIVFDDKAKNDGQLVFTFTPEGGAAKTISVTVAKKMDKKDAARAAETELKVGLGAGFDVDRYDPDKIKISGKKNAKFSLTISSLTANGLSVRLI